MFSMASVLWRFAFAGSFGTLFAFYEIDAQTAEQAGIVTGCIMFSAFLASLWDG